MRIRYRQTRAEPKGAALKINNEARLDAPQFIENNQKYARMTHRALEKHHIANANATIMRDATQRERPTHELALQKNHKQC